MSLTVQYNQSIFDVALQLTGNITGVFDLMLENEWVDGFSHSLAPGDVVEMKITPVKNERVINLYETLNIEPASRVGAVDGSGSAGGGGGDEGGAYDEQEYSNEYDI